MSENGNPVVVENLLQRLDETASALRASEVNGWDAITDLLSSMPSLLRQARAALGRLHAEVEELRRAQEESGRSLLPASEMPLARALADGVTVRDVEVLIRHADEDERVLLSAAVPVGDEEGNIAGGVVVFQDITAHKQAEEERERLLTESCSQRELLERLVNEAPVGIAVVRGPDHRYQMVNPYYRSIPGVPDVPMVGRTIAEVFPEVAAQGALELVETVYRTGRTISLREYEASVGPGREQTVWNVDHVPLRGPDGDVESVLILASEVTEQVLHRKQAEELAMALQNERNILQVIMENTRAHLAYLDPQFNFVAVNSTYVQGCGYGREELLGRNHFALFPHVENQAIFEWVRETGEPIEFHAKPFEFPNQPELGITYWDWTLVPVKGTEGQVEGLVLSLMDVTQQVRAQAEIESLSRFPRENPNPVLRMTRDGTILYANRGSAPLLAQWGAQVGQQAPDEWLRYVAGALDTGVEQVFEAPCDGRTFSLTIAPLAEKGYANLYGLDITDLKKAQQALRHYAERLRGLHEVDQAILAARSVEEIASAALQRTPQLFDCLHACITLIDLEAQEMSLLAAWSGGEIVPEGDGRAAIDDGWARALEIMARGEEYFVEDVQRVPPTSEWWRTLQTEGVRALVGLPLIIEGELIGSLNLGMRRPEPLTADQVEIARELAIQAASGIQQARLHEHVQRHADQLEEEVQRRTRALRASEARFRAIFEGAGIGVALLDMEGRVQESNPALQELLGYSAEELRGKPFTDFSHPDDVATDVAFYEELMAQKGGVGRYRLERRYIRRDGRLGWANVTVSLVQEHRGKPQFLIVMVEDVTEQRRSQEALIQSEKLAVTGRLAASLAHEINNPLQSVIGSLELVEESLAEGRDAGQFLQLATRELERAASIVSQLRDLNRPSKPGGREPTDVVILVDHVLALTRKQCQRQGVEVAWEAVDNLPLLMLVPDRIQQVFLNLVLNAVEAMPEGGRLEIRASSTDEPAGVRISFADSGKGIAADATSNLFEPFYTTKPDGLGLGLYVTHDIVEEHGGLIEVKSREGEGATFTVWLPA